MVSPAVAGWVQFDVARRFSRSTPACTETKSTMLPVRLSRAKHWVMHTTFPCLGDSSNKDRYKPKQIGLWQQVLGTKIWLLESSGRWINNIRWSTRCSNHIQLLSSSDPHPETLFWHSFWPSGSQMAYLSSNLSGIFWPSPGWQSSPTGLWSERQKLETWNVAGGEPPHAPPQIEKTKQMQQAVKVNKPLLPSYSQASRPLLGHNKSY